MIVKNKKDKIPFTGRVRPLTVNDLEEVKPILEVWLKDRVTNEPLTKEVDEGLEVMKDSVDGHNDRSYLVAEDAGKVIGIVGMKNPDEVMLGFARTQKPYELVNAYVDPRYRKGRGVGRSLVAGLESLAKQKGHKELILNSGPRYKDTGWGFYDKLPGYKRVGLATEYYGVGGDAPVWSKVLK